MVLKRIAALLSAAALSGCPGGTESAPDAGAEVGKLRVFATFATEITEPWDGVIHQALQEEQQRGNIEYTHKDAIGYDPGAMEGALRTAAGATPKPDVIFGDAFGNEEAVRKVAKEFQDIKFVFGSGFGPVEPNLSVFDNWIHEPAYLCGMIAGRMTKTGKVGVVGGMKVAEVNRVVNAFVQGVKETKPDAKVFVGFIDSWFDKAKAAAEAEKQIAAGADLLFAERAGVIEVATQHKVFAFGNMLDQSGLGPQTVITGPVWNMSPTVTYVVNQVKGKTFTAQDLKDFSMMAKGGARLAPYSEHFKNTLPPNVVTEVNERSAKIMSGLFRVPILEETPTGD